MAIVSERLATDVMHRLVALKNTIGGEEKWSCTNKPNLPVLGYSVFDHDHYKNQLIN